MNLNDKNKAVQLLMEHVELWSLQTDGDAFYTPCSLSQPVLHEGLPAMLKIAIEDEERKGALLMN